MSSDNGKFAKFHTKPELSNQLMMSLHRFWEQSQIDVKWLQWLRKRILKDKFDYDCIQYLECDDWLWYCDATLGLLTEWNFARYWHYSDSLHLLIHYKLYSFEGGWEGQELFWYHASLLPSLWMGSVYGMFHHKFLCGHNSFLASAFIVTLSHPSECPGQRYDYWNGNRLVPI